jgi:peroxiredoxin
MKKIILLVLAGLIILLAIGTIVFGAETENTPAPDFALKDLDGNALTLGAFKGKVLLLNFWATWCPPCRAEIPDFVETYRDFKVKGLEIIGVSVDKVTPAKLRNFLSQAKINYPIALADRKFLDDYEPGNYIPVTILIDKKGVIRFRQVGQIDKETLIKLFNQYIVEP